MSANWQGSATSAEPQFTNTLDFWKYNIIPHPLHTGVGLCYNLLNKLELGDDFNEKEKNNFSNWHISLRCMG